MTRSTRTDIAVEGLDGAGKSTLIDGLLTAAKHSGIRAEVLALYRRDPVEAFLDKLDKVVQVPVDGGRYAVMAKLLARESWYAENVRQSGRPIIYDKHILTFVAGALARGGSVAELTCFCESITPPAKIAVLDVDPSVALTRKSKIGYFESGLDSVVGGAPLLAYAAYQRGDYDREWLRNRFVEFQSSIRDRFAQASNMLLMSSESVVEIVNFDAHRDRNELANDAVKWWVS